VRETLNLMHKLFRLRSCEDSVFRNRSRPCLQHQIGRCSAPCVGLVEAAEYAEAVRRAGLFLDGRSDELGRRTDVGDAGGQRGPGIRAGGAPARPHHHHPQAAGAAVRRWPQCRPRRAGGGDAGCIGLRAAAGAFRDGRNLGTRAFFPKTNGEDSAAEVLAAFVSQYYAEQPPPTEIVLDRDIPERE
jgi:excinuclease ABC subunit C